jgi:hypothetical protein
VLWAKQLFTESGKAEILGLEVRQENVRLELRFEGTLMAGNKKLAKTGQNDFSVFRIGPDGEVSPAGLDTGAVPDSNPLIKKTGSRNGNSYLAYGRSSALVPPFHTEWSLAFLDGNGNRLWDIHLDSSVQINCIRILANGNCLLGGYRIISEKNRDLWLAVFNTGGKPVWQKSAGGKSAEEVLALEEDAEGTIYSSGYCSPDSVFLGNSDDLSGRDADGFISAYAATGNEKFFYRQRGKGMCRVEKILCLENGNLLFTSALSGSEWRLPPFGFPKKGLQDVVIGLIDTRTGKEKENPLHIFPNPARETVYFGLTKPEISGKARAILHQKDGTVLQEMPIKADKGLSYRFNVSNTKPGTYFITLKAKNRELKERLMVE